MGTRETMEKSLKKIQKHLKKIEAGIKISHPRSSEPVSLQRLNPTASVACIEGASSSRESLSLYHPHHLSGGECFNILESMGHALHILDPQFRIVYWNRRAENIFGYAAADVLGKSMEALMYPDKYELAYQIVNRVKMGESWAGRFSVRNKMGRRFTVVSTCSPFYNDDGTLAGLISICNDARAFGETTVPTLALDSEHIASASNKVDVHKDSLDYEILWEDLTIGESVGQGSCGTVYRALWHGTDVAVKVFSKKEFSDDLIQSFKQEVSLMTRLRHPNILLFMGIVTTPKRLCIVTEFLPRGSLYHLLRNNNVKPDWRRRVQMAIDIARGVNYLHRCKPAIVHRDLKSPNLLVAKNWTVKVCDFGLSRVKYATNLMTSGKGTPQWMAPELIRDEPSNEKSDVYSFGVIMWELATGKIPWEDHMPVQVITAVGVLHRRLEIPNDIDPQWASMIESCWHSDPASRPTFEELLESLKELQGRTKRLSTEVGPSIFDAREKRSKKNNQT